MLKKDVLFAFLLLFISSFGYSQTNVEGRVKNKAGLAIPFATITLIDTLTNDIIQYTSASKNGEFVINANKSGIYHLVARALGYKADTALLNLSANKKQFTKEFILPEDVSSLKEVIVSASKPIIIKEDTIIIDAKSFALGNEQVAEDLLKRIPGVEVTADGTIKVGNREVERVMVDGDDFFERGYKLLTKNLNADAIDKVEIYDKYSKNRLLKNIENSDKVALNLKLNANSKQQWFGNVSAGYGIDNRHEARLNLMAYKAKSKYYFLGNMNNVGYDASGDINALVSPQSTSPNDILEERHRIEEITSLNVKQPQLRRNRINFNNVVMPALNGIWTLNDKMKLKALSLINIDDNSFIANGAQNFFTAGQSFQINESKETIKKTFSGIGRVNYVYDMSKNSALEYTGLFNQSNNRDTGNAVFNVNPIHERLAVKSRISDHKISLTNKITPKTVILTSARYLNENQEEHYDIDSVRYSFLDPTLGKAKISQDVAQHLIFGAFDAKLMHKLQNGSLLEVQAGFNSRKNTFNTEMVGTNIMGLQTSPHHFGNQTTYTSSDLYLKTNYRYKVKDFNFVAGLAMHQLMNKLNNADTLALKRQTPFFLVPMVGLEWQINKTNKLTATYRYSFNNSGINDVYPAFTFADFRTINRGIGDFNQMNTSAMLINYRLGNWGDNFFMNATTAYKYDKNFISTDNFLQPDFVAQSKIVLGNRSVFSTMLNADRFIKAISSNIKGKFSFDDSEYKSRINGLAITTNALSYNYGFEMRTAFSGFFNFNIGRSWSYNKIKSTFDNSFRNNMTFLDFDFIFKNDLSFRTQAEFYQFENMNTVNKQLFIDAEIRYVYLPNKLTLFLIGRNLLNRKSYTELTNQDISVSTWQYRLVPRIVNLKIDYRF